MLQLENNWHYVNIPIFTWCTMRWPQFPTFRTPSKRKLKVHWIETYVSRWRKIDVTLKVWDMDKSPPIKPNFCCICQKTFSKIWDGAPRVTHGTWENMRHSTGDLLSLCFLLSTTAHFGPFASSAFFLPTGVASDEFRTTSTIYFSFFSWRKKIGSGTSITGNTQWQLIR